MTAGLSVTVIVTDEGVGVFKTPFSKHITRIGQLAANGLVVVLCEASVRTRNTSLEHLAPFCKWTPIGVVEIVRLQKAGASFLSVADSHYA